MRQKIVAGNWKMNTTIPQGKELVEALSARRAEIPANVKLIVCPPFTHLYAVTQILKDSPIGVGAQNCANKESGAYTGEVAAAMVESVGCQYVILGHSERREYYFETSETLLDKIKLALAHNLTPIFCVGERLEERESNMHFQVISAQLREVLCQLAPEDFAKVIVAYEPVWAIGTGKTATSDQAQEVHAFIRAFLAETFGALAENTSILYGGSCKPSNAKELFAQEDVDGGLIGGASLKADDFLGIAKSF